MPTQPATDYRIQHFREKLGGLYEFQALLGRGAFAAVYLVRNLRLDRLEALKVLSDVYEHDDAFVRRFIQEAKLVASLDHPNIVKVYDFGEVDRIVWFSMQHIDGPTLRAELTAQGRLSPIAVVRLAISLLGALGYSHQMGTVHRDIKPSNILLDRRGHPYIMDFGIAKSDADVLKTMTGRILGTPAYISPEQIQGHTVDGRADLYSLAIAMYEMLAGQIPFRAKDPLQIVVKRLHEDPDPLRKYCLTADESLEALIMRGLAREPEDRFADAEAMRSALVEYLSEQPDQQELVLVASAPEPVAIERLPTTVQDPPAHAFVEKPTVKMRRIDPDGDSLRMGKRVGRWALAVAAFSLLALASLFLSQRLEDPTPPSSTGSAAAVPPPTAQGDEQPRAAALEQVDSVDASTQPGKPLPTATESTGDEVEPAPRPRESVVVPPPSPPPSPPAKARADRPAASRPPEVPQPAPARRPVTVPKILSAAEPVLSPDRAAECIGQAVIVSLRVGEDGRVLRSRILKAGTNDCTEAARRAAEAYIFEPARDFEGQPVAASTTLNIRFNEVTE